MLINTQRKKENCGNPNIDDDLFYRKLISKKNESLLPPLVIFFDGFNIHKPNDTKIKCTTPVFDNKTSIKKKGWITLGF